MPPELEKIVGEAIVSKLVVAELYAYFSRVQTSAGRLWRWRTTSSLEEEILKAVDEHG